MVTFTRYVYYKKISTPFCDLSEFLIQRSCIFCFQLYIIVYKKKTGSSF